jgi:hypothetical protein
MLSIFTNEILVSVAQFEPESITGFLPTVGRKYTGELMVVGRAPNGWLTAPKQLTTLEARTAFAHEIYESVTGKMPDECPMSWVTVDWGNRAAKYNPAKSAFWRVVRKVVNELSITDVTDQNQQWSSSLVWSNLYKISPVDGGNPGAALLRAQSVGCIRQLKMEIEKYEPKRLLFLTGYSWAEPFISEIWQADLTLPGNSIVEGFGEVKCGEGTTTVVIAPHPQGKKEKVLVSEVVSLFNGHSHV